MTRGFRGGASSAPSSQGEGWKPIRARSPEAGGQPQPEGSAPCPGRLAPRREEEAEPRRQGAGPKDRTGRPRAAATPLMATQTFPTRPSFPQKRGEEEQRRDWARKETRTLRPVPRETPEFRPSPPPRAPAPTLTSHPRRRERRFRRQGGAEKGRGMG